MGLCAGTDLDDRAHGAQRHRRHAGSGIQPAVAPGAYLNELCDITADCALILPFALLPGVSLWLVLLVALLALFSEYSGVLGPMVGASRRYDGPMGKSDRAFVLGIVAVGIALGWLSPFWINAVFAIIAMLLVYTLVNRVRQGLKEAITDSTSA